MPFKISFFEIHILCDVEKISFLHGIYYVSHKMYGLGINTQKFSFMYSLFPIESLSDIDKSNIALTLINAALFKLRARSFYVSLRRSVCQKNVKKVSKIVKKDVSRLLMTVHVKIKYTLT